ncbi:DNA-binding protein rif1 [Gamsiella multidivaricata]|nr:DNA-binding protein rif1 [Gamsiella multidivaricata]
MDSPSSTPNKSKKSTKKQAQISSPAKSTSSHSRTSASPSSSPSKIKSPLKPRREEDLSYLERPKVPKPTQYPPQPPLNARFERPKTRAHRVSEADSDPIEPGGHQAMETSRSTTVTLMDSTTTEEVPTAWEVPPPPETGEEDDASNDTMELVRAEQVEDALKDVMTEEETAGHAAGCAPFSDFEAVTVSEVPSTTAEILVTVSNTEETGAGLGETAPDTLIPDEDRNRTPPPTTIDKLVPHSGTPITPVTIPAQIAVVNASPSKRVAFSPNKQESRLSNPSTLLSHTKLKSILKPPAPFRIEEADNERSIAPISEAEPFITDAMFALTSEDPQLRAATYLDLQAKLRMGDGKMYQNEVRETIRRFTAYSCRDLDPSNPSALVQAVLKCIGFYFFNQSFAALFTAQELDPLMNRILHIINTTNEKPTCTLAIWCFVTSRVPSRLLTPYITRMVQVFSDNLDNRFQSMAISSESLVGLFSLFSQFPGDILPHVQTWLIPVISKLVVKVPGIRSKALELITMATPKLIEKEDPRRKEAVTKFMNERFTEFFESLTKNFLENGDEVYAVTVWGAMVTLIGRDLQKRSFLNPMLKMVEKCFNTSSQRRTEIKMAAYQAWTRLIYNFAAASLISHEKPLKLLLTPITNCFSAERHKRVRLGCTSTWFALIYALGPYLPKNADEVLFPQLMLAVVDDSEHIRDVTLRLLVALFSNSGGQELVEGTQYIVPGTITFADLRGRDETWVRTELLAHGLDCIYQTIRLQHKISDSSREEWRCSALTGLPILTERCARTWESIVKAIRDLNLQERGMKATADANQSLSSLLFFIERVSHCDPKTLIPIEWPDTNQKEIGLLKRDPAMAGYILRADIVHYFYVSVIEAFSIKTLVAARYTIRDKIHADVHSAIKQVSEPPSQASEVTEPQNETTKGGPLPIPQEASQETTLTPIEFILKCWLATGESVIGTAFETSFWQAVATLVDMSKSGYRVLGALYKCLDHMEDIRAKRQTSNDLVWPSESNGPVTPMVFREYQCKYWSIVAQRLGMTINNRNELSENTTAGEQTGYNELFDLLLYPFGILSEPAETKAKLLEMDHSQRAQLTQDADSMQTRLQFIEKFKAISMPTWTDLVRIFYRIAQHKRGNANDALNTLAKLIRESYDTTLEVDWIQSLSITCTSAIADTILLVYPVGSQAQGSSSGHGHNKQLDKHSFGELLNLGSFLFGEAYNCVERTKNISGLASIPLDQEAAFLMMEKIINKAPVPLIFRWLQLLEQPIIRWLDDPRMVIRNLPKVDRRAYQAKIEDFWSTCVLARLMSCSNDGSNDGLTSAFGTVLEAHVPTIRGAVQKAQASRATGDTPSSSTTTVAEPYNSESLAILAPLLFAGLNSLRKPIVNKTLEFWNKTFGRSKADLVYPEMIVSIMRQLKLVATISLPGWTFEDISQTEVPQFASLSQELFSLPVELKARTSLSRLLKQKAEAAAQQTAKKRSKQKPDITTNGHQKYIATTIYTSSTAHPGSPMTNDGSETDNSTATSATNSRAPSPAAPSTPTRSRNHTPAGDSDCSVQSNGEIKKDRKRKKTRIVHSLAIDPLTKTLVGRTSEKSVSGTPEDSADEVEISTPTKKPRKSNAKTTVLPTPPVWRMPTALKPLHGPAKGKSLPKAQMAAFSGFPEMDPSSENNFEVKPRTRSGTENQESVYFPASKVSTNAMNDASATHVVDGQEKDAQGDMTMDTSSALLIFPSLRETEGTKNRSRSGQQAIGSSDAAFFDGSTSPNVFYSAGSEEARRAPEASDDEEAGIPRDQLTEIVQMEEMRAVDGAISTPAFAPGLAPTPMEFVAPIETGEGFAMAVRRLVEARAIVGQLSMR